MADDDDDRTPAPDPWDEIVAEGLGDDFGDETLPFAEAAADAAAPAEPIDQALPADGALNAAAHVDADLVPGNAEDASIEDWLKGDDLQGDGESPVLSVFAPEESAAGLSGVDATTDGASAAAADGSDAFAALGHDDETTDDAWAGIEPVPPADADDDSVSTVDIAADAQTATAASVIVAGGDPQSDKPVRKSGGLGRVAGIALGGLLAIPAAGALLYYGLGQNPFGNAKVASPSVALSAPVPAATPPEASSVAEETVPAPAADPPVEPLPVEPAPAEPLPDAAMQAVVEPGPEAPVATTAVDEAPGVVMGVDEAPGVAMAVEPASEPTIVPDPEPAVMPEPAAPLDALADDAPGLDALAAEPPAPEPLAAASPPAEPLATEPVTQEPPLAPPPALETAALDDAVGEAAALSEALGAVDDRETRAYTLLRTRWYRSLARVAEELVALEHAAAAAGRPLDAPPENVALLHGTIAGREALAAELATLAPDWLAYGKRGSDGVVLPVTLDSVRKVGPYWTARATLDGRDGQPRSLTVISRSEPAGIAGDKLVVTGVALDGGVIWAVDVRGVVADGAAAPGF